MQKVGKQNNVWVRTYLFLQRILLIIETKIFYYYEPNLDNNLYIGFIDLLIITLRLVKDKKKLVDHVWTDKKAIRSKILSISIN